MWLLVLLAARILQTKQITLITCPVKVYISTRAEHHGPLGGGTLAIIARQFSGEGVVSL
jgi:hypothetical protein